MASKNSPAKATGTEVVTGTREQAIAVAQAAMLEMKQTDFDVDQMIVDIMQATSFDQILESPVIHLADIIGVPFTILSAKLADSTYEDSSLPAYAIMNVEFDDGLKAVVTTGATQVVIACVAAHANNWFPQRVSTSQVTTQAGFNVIKLVRPTD